MTDFWLVRHGSTETLDDRIAGWTPSVDLNAKGRAEVRVLAARVADSGVKHVYSSPLERARQTAVPLAAVLDCGLTTLDELGELHFGDWTNQRFSQLDRDPQWQRFNRFRSGTRIPGGESHLETQARAVSALLEVRALHPNDSVMIVSHGDVIKAIVLHFLGVSLDLAQRIDIQPASITRLELSDEHVRIRFVNDTAHLEDGAEHLSELVPYLVSHRLR